MSVQEVRKARRELMAWGNSTMRDIRFPRKQDTPAMQCWNGEYWLNRLVYYQERYFMAAKVTPKATPKRPDFKGFVNYVLSEADKVAFGQWDVDDHDLWLLVAGDLSAGYKISCSYNQANGTYVATYMCNDDTNPNAGYCLSAFAPDLYNAIKSLAFKHNVVLDGIWKAEEIAKNNNWG